MTVSAIVMLTCMKKKRIELECVVVGLQRLLLCVEWPARTSRVGFDLVGTGLYWVDADSPAQEDEADGRPRHRNHHHIHLKERKREREESLFSMVELIGEEGKCRPSPSLRHILSGFFKLFFLDLFLFIWIFFF